MDEELLEEILQRSQGHEGVVMKAAPKPPRSLQGRSAVWTMSTEEVDRYGDIIVTKGIDLKQFKSNPVLLLNHNSRGLPMGTWDQVKKGSGVLEGRGTFVGEGINPEADAAWAMIEAGVLRAASIGFMVTEAEYLRDEAGERITGIKFTKTELVECSAVTVPANASALAKGIADGVNITMVRRFAEDALDHWMTGPDGSVHERAHAEKMWKEIAEQAGVTVFAPKQVAPPENPAVKAVNEGFEAMKKFFSNLNPEQEKAAPSDDAADDLPPTELSVVKGGRARAAALELDLEGAAL